MTTERNIIARFSEQQQFEGLTSIATSKLKDLAAGFILKARPLIVLHRNSDDSTVTIKMRRGLINHSLIQDTDGNEKRLLKTPSAAILLTKAVSQATKLIRQGYIEI